MPIGPLLRLEHIDPKHLAQAGSNGANLGEIMAAVSPVAPGFVVPPAY